MTAFPFPQIFDTAVETDLMDPGPEIRIPRIPESIDLPEGLDECLLEDVLGVLGRMGVSAGEAVNAGVMALIELPKRVFVAVPG